MTWWQTTILAIGGIVGALVALKWLFLVAVRLLDGYLERAGYCEFCHVEPATLRVSLDDGPLFGCKPCLDKKCGRFFLGRLDAAGKLESIADSRAIRYEAAKAVGK